MSQDPSSPQQPAAPQPNAASPKSERPPRRFILEQPLGGARKILMFGLLAALSISIMFNLGLTASYQSYLNTDTTINEQIKRLNLGNVESTDKIAIISVSGTIMRGDGFVKRQIDRVRADDSVKGVVLRVNSPGGTVTASHYIYHHLKKLTEDKEIPLVVSMGSLAASGGYYVAMASGDQEDVIFAEPSTWTGSIGVIIPSYDLSDLMSKWGIDDRSFTSGPYKQTGTPTRAMNEDEKKVFQTLVDESFKNFKDIVRAGRPGLRDDEDRLTKATTGQIFTAKQAKDLGLVDRFGYIEDAVERAAVLANLPQNAYRVVEYSKPAGFLETALGGSAKAGQVDLGAFLDMTAPRAYYLASWLPSVAKSNQ